MQAGELRNKIDVYALVEEKNSLGAMSKKPKKIKRIWAKIVPTSGYSKEEKGNVTEIEVSHKITVRANALKGLTAEYYIVYQGQKYEILYWYPNYKENNYMELFCRLEVSK